MPNARCEVGPLRANPRAATGVQMPRREPSHYRYEALCRLEELPGTPAPPQRRTGNAQQCRSRKALMRNTAASCFSSARVALRFSR
jgi:hypothetical protein